MRVQLSLFVLSVLFIVGCSRPAEQSNSAQAPPSNAGLSGNSSNVAPPEFSGATNTVPMGNSANGAVKPDAKNMPAPKGFEIGGKEGPAPDDSDVKTALGENLVQTRTFHSNPQITKLERTTVFENGEPKSITKVFLKNGQVKDLSSAVKDPMSASAAEILKGIH
jgi:hypothetical protein